VLKQGEQLTLYGFRTSCKQNILIVAVGTFTLWFALGSSRCACASEAAMRGPNVHSGQPLPTQEISASCFAIAFLESIKLYQKWISPIGGERCGFRPSCSRYGYASIMTQGPIVGLLMTGDRLTRCNIWKRPGPDYLLLPNGRLYDPPSNNLLLEK